jgi:hypothetical protein
MKTKAKQLNVLVGQSFWNTVGVTLPSATTVVVTSLFVGKTAAGSSTQVGVYTTNPQNYVIIRLKADGKALVDTSGRQVFARLTYSVAVWTLSFYVLIAGVETPFDFTAHPHVGEAIDFRWCETVQIANLDPTSVVFNGEGVDEIVSADAFRHQHVIETLTVASDGQTAFAVTYTPKHSGLTATVRFEVNGVEQALGVDYTITGKNITWLDADFTLQTTDKVVAFYETDEAVTY